EGGEIWLYDRIRSSCLDRFLATRLAERLRASRPFTGPAEPACLARPKPNLADEADARRTVRVADDDALEVRFARPVAGRAIDFAADHTSAFDLTLQRDGAEVVTLVVPAVPWHGACYGPPGLQARLVPVPPAARLRGWDRVVVRHRRGMGSGRVGH